MTQSPSRAKWRDRWYDIIFEADTPAGKAFDILLLIAILLSIIVIMLESVETFSGRYGNILFAAEWFLTIAFSAEYLARLATAKNPLRYATSFYGVVDLLSIIPTYLTLLPMQGDGIQRLVVIRSLRLLRAFRVLKLAHMLSEAAALRHAVHMARAKIAVFMSVVLIAIVIVGSAMHLIEEGRPGFESIPASMYWAVVTMTTVGFGDAVPTTALGKFVAASMMLLGYCLIIVPTSIVSAELANQKPLTTRLCPTCHAEGHDRDAKHCKFCGTEI